MTSTRKHENRFRLRIRGMSREALNWARAQALSEGKTIGHLLNELMYAYWNNISRYKGTAARCPVQRLRTRDRHHAERGPEYLGPGSKPGPRWRERQTHRSSAI